MTLQAKLKQPLLSDAEINALIHSAQTFAIADSQQAPMKGRAGETLASTVGSGSDFAEVRAYQPGDDPRHIDWRASARAQSALTRTYHAEFSRPLYLVIDRSASMRFATRKRLKVTQALRYALPIAAAAVKQGRELGVLLIDDPCTWLPAQRGMPALQNLIDQANRACPPIEAAPAGLWDKMLSALRQRLPAGAELVVISDFNQLPQAKQTHLGVLARHCSMRAVIIQDPAEIQLPDSDNIQLVWNKQRVTASTSNHAGDNKKLEKWRAELQSLFTRYGIPWQLLQTDHAE